MPFWHSVQELSRLVARISESAYTTAVEALAHVDQVRLQAPAARNALSASPTQSAPTFKRTRCLALSRAYGADSAYVHPWTSLQQG